MTDLGTRLNSLERRMAAVERSSRLGSAAIDDTALEVRDDTGSLRALVGQQGDGTTAVNVVNGPTPPAPTAPLVASTIGGIAAEWDGQLVDGAGVPLDFARVEVHAAASSGFTPTSATLVGTIETAQGAMVVIPTTTPLYVRLVTRTTSGTASAPSTQNGPIAPALIVADDVADGIITGTKLAADAIDGLVITGATLRTAASGQRIELTPDNVITIYNSAGTVVSTISEDGYKVWDTTGAKLLAEVTLEGGFFNDPGFIARLEGAPHIYSFFGNGEIQWLNEDTLMNIRPVIAMGSLPAETDEINMTLIPGAYTSSANVPRLVLGTSAAGNSEFRVDSRNGADPHIKLNGPVTSTYGQFTEEGTWSTPTFTGWKQSTNTTYQTLRCSRGALRARLDGCAMVNSAMSIGVSQNVCTLPTGMWPLKAHYFDVPFVAGSTPAMLGCRVGADGVVTVWSGTARAVNDLFDFSVVSWPLN
ncbi:hypothetical protein [Streptomyces zaomyceticus]|uniref:hypothetical protein n=1 Tax=Streptomyces zaomyceticus TaxID=68286 RepID=UPI0037B941F0